MVQKLNFMQFLIFFVNQTNQNPRKPVFELKYRLFDKQFLIDSFHIKNKELN